MELVYYRNSLMPIPYPQGDKVYKLALENHWELHTRFLPRLSIPDLVFSFGENLGWKA